MFAKSDQVLVRLQANYGHNISCPAVFTVTGRVHP